MELLRPPAHVPHYPLDVPLPFERYEHRRLTARDILVHRIVSALLFPPTAELAHALDSHRKHRLVPRSEQYCCAYHKLKTRSKTIPQHNFGPIKQHDTCLARDVEVLRKMLVTRSDTEWVGQVLVKPVLSFRSVFQPPQNLHVPATEPPEDMAIPTVEEEVLDLVRRHYMETDDACTRLWLQAIQPTQRSSYTTVPKTTAKRHSRKEVVGDRRDWDERNASEDYKRWYEEDTARLRALQAQTRTAHESWLYEGGAFLPALRRPQLECKAARKKYLHAMSVIASQSLFAEERDGQMVQDRLYPWPEPKVPRRVLHVPSWYSWRQKHDVFSINMPPVDFASGRTGRGLDRDGIWSTGWWYGDNVPRGRTMRRSRRRAASEPPHGMFTAARLPVGFNSSREVLIFPKMTLTTIDRRTRRRSLSRTRIAEQFNWDIVLEEPPQQPTRADIAWKRALAAATRFVKGTPSVTDTEAIHHRGIQQRDLALYHEIIERFGRGDMSLAAVEKVAWAWAPSNEAGVHKWPDWWQQVSAYKMMGEGFADRLLRGENQARRNTSHEHPADALGPPPRLASLSLQEPQPAPKPKRCENCASPEHITASCTVPCGYCGAPNPTPDCGYIEQSPFQSTRKPWDPESEEDREPSQPGRHGNPHLAPHCPVSRENRCKCTPFPQFHVAARCNVLCSRDCGTRDYPPGHFRHKNAMGCKSRCCMCGIRGHSGVKCKLRRCRCGGEHLGQDCGWHPECTVKGCDRFLCGVHCQGCGLDRAKLDDGVALAGRRCHACVESGAIVPVSTLTKSVLLAGREQEDASSDESGARGQPGRPGRDEAEHKSATQRGGRRKNRRKHRSDGPRPPKEEKPWYAPLEPRTAPVAVSKSGKRGKWSKATDTELPVRIGGCR